MERRYRVRPSNKRKVRLAVTRETMWWIRGLLIARLRRHVTWQEICDWTGISFVYMQHITRRGVRGGVKTVNALLKLREMGLMIHLSDFEVDPATLTDWRTWTLTKNHIKSARSRRGSPPAA